MGSATTHALAATRAALDATSGVDLTVAGDLFRAALVVGGSSPLAGALSDASADPAARAQVVARVFGAGSSSTAVALLTTAVEQRWSSAAEFVDGLEELAVRATTVATPDVDLEDELSQIARMVAENPELELALGSRLGDPAAKGALVESLLRGRASEAAALVVSSLVRGGSERRPRQLLQRAVSIAADQRGQIIATVVSASPISAAQAERLRAALSLRYDARVSLNTVIDPAIVGGLRIRIADDVIDASVSARLADLRQRLAG